MSDWRENDSKSVWHPFTAVNTDTVNVPIVRGEGAWLIDADGKRYLDAISSWWVNLHGHCNPHISKRVAEQVGQLEHVMFAGFTHEPAVELATRLLEHMPEQFTKVFYSDNGSTAVEVALKMAFQYWFNQGTPKRKVIALEDAYHGDTFGAMSVGERGYFNQPFEHLFFGVDFIDLPTDENWNEIEARVEKLFASGEFAGFIFEPLVQGSAGMRMYKAKYLEKLIVLAKKYDVLTISDEVMTGNGRTGKMFAFQHTNVTPDIVCVSKGVSGGALPIGLTCTRDEIYNHFLSDEKPKALLHGHSFTGNPICCAAVDASLDLFKEEYTWDNIKRIENLNKKYAEKLHTFENAENIRQTGTILAFEIKDDQSDYFSSVRDEAYQFFIDRGVLIRPLGNTIYTNPPYVITDEELDKVWDIVFDFLKLKA